MKIVHGILIKKKKKSEIWYQKEKKSLNYQGEETQS